MSIVLGRPRILDAPKVSKTSKATKDKKKKETAAINMLVEMDARHKQCLGAGDKKALEGLAIEYDSLNCPHLANQIRAEADNL